MIQPEIRDPRLQEPTEMEQILLSCASEQSCIPGLLLIQTSKYTDIMETEKKSLVAFFSRAGENYAVGNVSEGNTGIVAGIIAEETGSDLFRIETKEPYPEQYGLCVKISIQEKRTDARPDIKGDIRVEDYDMIYLGYPNWCGDMPMAVYTFISRHDWHGKTIAPFCTNEGSGLSGTEERIRSSCPGATVLEGLSVRGTDTQADKGKVRLAVESWLEALSGLGRDGHL